VESSRKPLKIGVVTFLDQDVISYLYSSCCCSFCLGKAL